jgi:hypothetical protein
MKWNIQKHKVSNSSQELKAIILVKEMQETWASDSESWCRTFQDKLKEIPKTNAYTAEYGYRAKPINHTSLEVWKMKANSDFNYKMFTVTRDDKNESH